MRKPWAAREFMVSLLVAGCLLIGWPGPNDAVAAENQPLVVFRVRHAEKVDDSRDPPLSEAGKHRADDLSRFLRDAGIQYIHSSDYLRTRDTASPIAERLGLDVELYDPRDLPQLVKALRHTGGRHLVVGHSNTTPTVVELLGGEPGAPIEEASEYDRLYCLTIDAAGQVSTVLMRYGASVEVEP